VNLPKTCKCLEKTGATSLKGATACRFGPPEMLTANMMPFMGSTWVAGNVALVVSAAFAQGREHATLDIIRLSC